MIGPPLAYLFAAGLLLLGTSTFPFPALLSRAYGAPVDAPEGLTLVRAMGMRDIALGLAVVVLLVRGNLDGAAVVLAVTAVTAAVDFGLVLSLRGRLIPQLVQHASGVVLGFGGAALLAMRL